jgi:hypothetical protein
LVSAPALERIAEFDEDYLRQTRLARSGVFEPRAVAPLSPPRR